MKTNILKVSALAAIVTISFRAQAQTSFTTSFSSETNNKAEASADTEIDIRHDMNRSSNTIALQTGYVRGTNNSGYTDTDLSYSYNFGEKYEKSMSLAGGVVLPTGDSKQGLGGSVVGMLLKSTFLCGLGTDFQALTDISFKIFPNYKTEDGFRFNRNESRLLNKFMYRAKKRISYTFQSDANWVDTLQADNTGLRQNASLKNELDWALSTGVEYQYRSTKNFDLHLGFSIIHGILPGQAVRGGSFFINWPI